MAELGAFSLYLALYLAGYAILVDLAGVWFRESGLMKSGRNAGWACWLCLSTAIVVLLIALGQSDFSIKYVADHTDRELATVYKLSALWAGAAGSLLLWLWLQVGMANLVFREAGPQGSPFAAQARAVTNIVGVFFLIILIFDRNVFEVSLTPFSDGMGLNPPLRHPAMVLHPPMLFLGYAGYLIPLAWAIAALGMPDRQNRPPLFLQVRNWMLIAWIFLTLGNALGSWWAYEELGWGGFWAWDPVENSSLMPWLTGTALLHSFKRFRPRSSAARWVLMLCLITYSLCIFGRFLTKYGLVKSVHAFTEKGWGILYLALIGVLWTIALILVVRRLRLRSPVNPTARIRGDGVITFTNWIFVILVLVILIGSIFPFLSGLFSSKNITLEPAYFTKITAPGGILLLLLIGICPSYFRRGFDLRWRTLLGLIFSLGALATWFLSCSPATPRPESLSRSIMWVGNWLLSGSPKIPCLIMSVFAAFTIMADFYVRRRSDAGENDKPKTPRPLRWYGARMAHIGVVMMFIGIAGSEGYGIEHLEAQRPGESFTMPQGNYEFTFEEFITSSETEYDTLAAKITVNRGGRFLTEMAPSLRYYDNYKPTSEPDIRRTFAGDLYLSLTGADPNRQLINLRVLIKPLINWLWLGSIALVLGTIMVLIPGRGRKITA